MKKYKCTYTSREGARCPVMGKFNKPNPSHCFAYDCKIWNINPKKTCEYCVLLEKGEKPEKKIWCDDTDHCDSYNDGGSEKCVGCPGGYVVFDPSRKIRRKPSPPVSLESLDKTLDGIENKLNVIGAVLYEYFLQSGHPDRNYILEIIGTEFGEIVVPEEQVKK